MVDRKMLVTLVVFSTSVFPASIPAVVVLDPSNQFSITAASVFQGSGGLSVREARIDGNGLWLLLQAKEAPMRFAIIKTDLAGVKQKSILLPKGAIVSGLAKTEKGVAVLRRTEKGAQLVEFGEDGSVLLEREVACGAGPNLLMINGRPSTICADGTITTSTATGTLRRSSWARPGAVAELASDQIVAIVDQATGQIILNDVSTNGISTVTQPVPEIVEALDQTRRATDKLLRSLPPGGPPPGQQLVVMDTARDASGWYVLVWPYHRTTGARLVKLSSDGQILGRYRCRLPISAGPIHLIDVQERRLILTSVRGDVYVFAL